MAYGVTQFCIETKVSTADMARWSPERIQAFFSGIAAIEGAVNNTLFPPLAKYPPGGWITSEHIFAAKNFGDGCLKYLLWAAENGATVEEMKAYRRAAIGEDLQAEAAEDGR